MPLQHLRSSTANKRPVPGNMSEGQLAMNTASGSPGLFFRDSNSNLVKVGPVHVGTTAPNASPASGGTAGNSVGEQWLDTSSSRYVFKIWDGSAWRSEDGEFVNASGDVMTGALGIIAGSAASPGLYVSGDANTGVYSPGADQLALATGGTGRLFVDSNGYVDVASTSSPLSIVSLNATTTGNASLRFSDTTANVGNINYNFTDDAMTFRVNASERMRLDSSGRLGLGTSSPGALLHANGAAIIGSSAAAQPNVTLNTGAVAGTRNLSIRYVSGGTAGSLSGDYAVIQGLYDGVGYPSLALNPSGGNVGIGTTSPGSTLDVNGTIRAGNYHILDGSTSAAGVVGFSTSNGPSLEFWGSAAAGSGALIAKTAGSERARIDSSGRLLVGTSTSVSTFGVAPRLQIAGNESYQSNIAYRADAFAPFISIGHSRNATVGSQTILQSGDDFGTFAFVGSDGTGFIRGAQISAAVDGTPGANDMPGRIVLSTTSDGASSPTERLRVTSDGYVRLSSGSPGIQFGGDTAAANALDDYEEGTFTPTIVGTSTAGTATYGANGQVGRYTKIGNRVFFDLYLSWTAHTGTGDLQINGLPFTVQNTTNLNRNYSAILNVVAMTAGSIGAAFSSPNTTTVALRQMPTGGGSVATIPMDTSAQISISGCFEA